jgi:pimeloyl-ACP methyl ester carboxylesterase
MSIRQIPARAVSASLRRQVLPTELGTCTVRVNPGAEGPGAVDGMADVYLHGAAGSWTTFLPLLSGEPVRDQVLIDLPGWGESTKGTRPEQFTLEAMERVITGVLNSLGYARWNLVGHSMGGLLALHIAAARPDRTASVATISATTFAVAETVRQPLRGLFRFPAFAGMLLVMRSMAALGPAGVALIRAIGATRIMGPLMSAFFAEPATIPKAVIRGLAADARPASFAAAARAAADYDFGQWRGISCPVLATRGDTDVFTPASDLTRLADIMPHLQRVTIPRCGHFANIEYPGTVQRLLNELHSLR